MAWSMLLECLFGVVATALGSAWAGLAKDSGILRTVVRANDGFAGLNTTVLASGVVRVGDVVCLGAAN